MKCHLSSILAGDASRVRYRRRAALSSIMSLVEKYPAQGLYCEFWHGTGLRRDGPAGRGYARWFLGVRSQQSRTQRSSGLGPGACTPGPSCWLHLSGERLFAHSPPARGSGRKDRMFVTGDHLPSMETGARRMTPLWFIAGDLPVLQTSFRRLFVTRMFIVVVSRGLIRARRRLR
jgi:hypothetical protein